MDYKSLRPSQVILDPQNPRLPDGTSSDREAINSLLDEGADALINLARDMAETGQTNPAELPIAIKQGAKYLMLEGNRRFAALKLLGDPALANNEDHRKAVRRAGTLGAPPRTVFTLVAPSREAAEHWIFLRHTGENDGRGVRRWSAGQAATHRRRANRSIDSGTARSITIADELEEAYAGDEELTDLIRSVRRGKLTNIGRFFSIDVLDRLHFSIQDDESSALEQRVLLARHTKHQLRSFFIWAFTVILHNSVDAYKNKEIRRKLLLSQSDLLPKDADAIQEPVRIADGVGEDLSTGWPSQTQDGIQERDSRASEHDRGTNANGSASHSGAGGTRPAEDGDSAAPPPTSASRRKYEAKPEKYLLQNLRLPRHPQRVQKLLQECRELEIDNKPGVACVMMRVIVELSVSCDEILKRSQQREGDPLSDKIIGVLRYLDPEVEHPRKRDKGLEQAYAEASELGVEYLNGFVHNPKVVPDPHLARRFSSAFRPLLVQVDERL